MTKHEKKLHLIRNKYRLQIGLIILVLFILGLVSQSAIFALISLGLVWIYVVFVGIHDLKKINEKQVL